MDHRPPLPFQMPCTAPPRHRGIEVQGCLLAWLVFLSFPLVAATHSNTSLSPSQLEFFEQRIRPFLANDCYECHGPSKQKGGLRLDHRQGILSGGQSGPAILPGKSEQSLLIQAVKHQHPDLQMPKGRPAWPAEIIRHFESWIRDGAPDPRDAPLQSLEPTTDHKAWDQIVAARQQWWSFQPLTTPIPPSVQNQNWPRSDIDRFILARLEKEGLRPAKPAEPHVWLRRITLALTGLPPTPDEVHAYLRNPSPAAQNQIVDQLLASPHFGERWARHWMDLTRYAESYGHEQDYPIHHAWQYRDYLIRAFNDDVPYDQFVREHIAGDLLPNPRRNRDKGFNESIIATGFWFLHQATHAPVDPNQDEADRIDNQIDVLSKTFLGLTVGCARCHDHKFDPISMRDYYSLSAYLRSSRQDQPFLGDEAETQRIISELRRHHQEATPRIMAGIRQGLESGQPKVAAYWKGAQEVVDGKPQPQDLPPGTRPDVILDDFEDGTYARWEVEGEAFGPAPAQGQLPNQSTIENIQGARLANSFLHGDSSRGTLRSHPFIIRRPILRFWIGGGIPSGSARIALKIGDQEIRRASGKNRERLEPMTWDLRDWQNQEATLEIVDEESKIWGHILIDHIVLTDLETPPPYSRPVSVVAREFEINPAILERWVREWTSSSVKNAQHPWYEWRSGRIPTLPPQTIPAASGNLAPAPSQPWDPVAANEWFASGPAFKPEPGSDGSRPRWCWNGDQLEFIAPSTLFHSGELTRNLQGSVRSPSFVLNHENIHLLVSGNASHARLVIARYGLRDFNGLLFERTHVDINTDGRLEWKSMSQDLKRHIGRTAYLELVDPGPGALRIDRIAPSNHAAPPGTATPTQGPGSLQPASDPSLVPTQLEHSIHQALKNWLSLAPSGADNSSSSLLTWMSQKGLLDWGPFSSQLQAMSDQATKLQSNLPPTFRVLAITPGSQEETKLMLRGNPKQLGATVSPAFIQVLSRRDLSSSHPTSDRSSLADALLQHDAALADRVLVNRIWGHLFGRGIVPTVDNFGSMGVKPTHPELLDHLVHLFRKDHRSLKKFIRKVVLSHAYAMSSDLDDSEAERKDPDNSLLHRQRLLRLEGEIIRDQWLAISGRLDPQLHGPPVPTHFTPFMGDRMWVRNDNGPLDGHGRRSIYLESRRNFLSPFMLMFDLPIPESTVGKRNSSNVPGQALALMNDPLVQQLSRTWASNVVQTTSQDPEHRIRHMFLKALSRPPRPTEIQQILSLLDSLKTQSGSETETWAQVGHVILMMKEMIHVP